MKVFDTSGQQLVALGIDTGTSNALSVLSQAVSVLSQAISVVSNAASNALSVANAASNAASVVSQAVSVVSQALSSQAATLSVRIDTASNAASVVSQAVSVLSQSVSSQAAALSVRIDTQSQSISVLSQQTSVLSQAVSVLSQAVSVLSQQTSVLSQAVSALSQQLSIISVIAQSGLGQCYLSVKSITSVTLQPYQGQILWINGRAEKIPSAGVDMGTGGLTSATTYNLYAYMSAISVMTLTATVSAHATDSTIGNVGVEIKAGDASRTLVGKVRLDASVNFVNSTTQRFLINWFNRKQLETAIQLSQNVSVTSLTYVEVDTTKRVETLVWGNEDTLLYALGVESNGTAGGFASHSLGVDGTSALPGAAGFFVQAVTPPPQTYGFVPTLWFAPLAEGYHFVTFLGAILVATGVATFYGTVNSADYNTHFGTRTQG